MYNIYSYNRNGDEGNEFCRAECFWNIGNEAFELMADPKVGNHGVYRLMTEFLVGWEEVDKRVKDWLQLRGVSSIRHSHPNRVEVEERNLYHVVIFTLSLALSPS